MNANQAIFDIRGRLLAGIISYDQAMREASPVIEAMNIQAKSIAQKHGKKFRGFNFSQLMR